MLKRKRSKEKMEIQKSASKFYFDFLSFYSPKYHKPIKFLADKQFKHKSSLICHNQIISIEKEHLNFVFLNFEYYSDSMEKMKVPTCSMEKMKNPTCSMKKDEGSYL